METNHVGATEQLIRDLRNENTQLKERVQTLELELTNLNEECDNWYHKYLSEVINYEPY